MKIAVTSDTPGLDGRIPALFSESAYLLIVESDTQELLHVFRRDAGQDMAFARAILQKDCEGVLCGPIEREPFLVIADEGCVTRYNAVGMRVMEALAALESRGLALIRDYIGGTGCQEGGAGECQGHHHHSDEE